MKFSLEIINGYLGRRKIGESDEVPSIDKVSKEITVRKFKQWQKKGLISSRNLSVKYVVLNRIGAANWSPINHSSSITSAMAKLIFLIGTKSKLNFGEYVFDQTMKHVDSFVVKLPVTFPCLITGIILNQHPNIVHVEEIKNKKAVPLTLDYRLFVGAHVPNIVVSRNQDKSTDGNSSLYPNPPRRMLWLAATLCNIFLS